MTYNTKESSKAAHSSVQFCVLLPEAAGMDMILHSTEIHKESKWRHDIIREGFKCVIGRQTIVESVEHNDCLQLHSSTLERLLSCNSVNTKHDYIMVQALEEKPRGEVM
jgi:hypothetical protein